MPNDPSSQRKPAGPDDYALNRNAIRWLAQLPEEVRPLELGRKYPRIVNTIATKWVDFVDCPRYLDSLQMDDRRGLRQGFSFEIVQEIGKLREYFDSLYQPGKDLQKKSSDADAK